jgi:hypothetical protein
MFCVLFVAVATAGVARGAASVAIADPPHANCPEAKADGSANMTQDDPGYDESLDRDGDGIACEV